MNDQSKTEERKTNEILGHIVRRGLMVMVILIVLGVGYFFWTNHDSDPKFEPSAQPQQALPVSVVTVKEQTLPLHPRFLGRTTGSQIVEIRARVEGYLSTHTFDEGTRVNQGQQLFQIDPRPFETDLARAKAHLQSAVAIHARAQQQVKRYTELTGRQSATQGELEEWQQQLGVADADMAMAEAEIESALLNLEYTRIEAPISGMIGEALKETGSYVDSGDDGLVAVIQQVDPIEVRFSVTEQEILHWNRQVTAGQLISPAVEEMEVELTLSDGTTYAHRGHIDYVGIDIDETTGTSIIRALIPNPDRSIKPGQFVHVNLLGIARVGVIQVPQNAVVHNPTGMSVYVVNAENMIEVRPVTLGDWSGASDWIIESGLVDGDRVVISRLLMIRPGMPVQIVPATPNPNTTEDAHTSEGSES
ncbi:efflux transporter periplasmic adaptor subunit [bacterium]|nr:MAG: efflux transporter periplasmic adaptor subunit [bacterium]